MSTRPKRARKDVPQTHQPSLHDLIFSLPVELRTMIASHITDIRLKMRLRRVCRQWRSIIDNPTSWRGVNVTISMCTTVCYLFIIYLSTPNKQEFTAPILRVYHTRFVDGVRTTDVDNAYLLPRIIYASKLKVYGGSVSELRISDIQSLNRLTHLHEVSVSIMSINISLSRLISTRSSIVSRMCKL
jgi:hypothetical protein